jgi:hypothetical protein
MALVIERRKPSIASIASINKEMKIFAIISASARENTSWKGAGSMCLAGMIRWIVDCRGFGSFRTSALRTIPPHLLGRNDFAGR